MLRPDHRKLAERIMMANHLKELTEDLTDNQVEFVVNVLATNEGLTDKQELNLKWIYERKVLGNKTYYSDILRKMSLEWPKTDGGRYDQG